MIKVTLEQADGKFVELWQEGGVHWAAGTVLDALTSDAPPERIIVEANAVHPHFPAA
jgi:hypothetical protein